MAALAPSAGSRRRSNMAAVGGTPDGRWTRPIPPLTHSGPSASADRVVAARGRLYEPLWWRCFEARRAVRNRIGSAQVDFPCWAQNRTES
jgi:hypothetical protein